MKVGSEMCNICFHNVMAENTSILSAVCGEVGTRTDYLEMVFVPVTVALPLLTLISVNMHGFILVHYLIPKKWMLKF